MKTFAILIATICCTPACADDPPPSCQQAMAGYYGAGCTFVDLTMNNRPIPQTEATANCQSLAGSLSSTCEAKLDDWLSCLDVSSPAKNCDCSQQQMAVIACH